MSSKTFHQISQRLHTRTFLILAALTATLAPPNSSLGGTLNGENLLTSLPAGFKIGFQAVKGPMTIAEYVPTAETVQDWSQMVTVQVFHNAPGADPDGLAGGVKGGWMGACPGSDVRKIKDGTENGYRFSLWLFMCAQNPGTGKPENMFAKIISGNDSLHSVQYAYRTAMTREMIPPTMKYLETVQVCDTRKSDHPCPAGM
jgi:hypothetical protein